MRTTVVTLLLLAVAAPAASAAITADVRIEGVGRTIFEGPVRSDVRLVQASSDVTARTCDGTNNGMNPSPSPTATSVTADALALSGQTFDGRWYTGYQDYLIGRLGPESSAGWGLYRNDTRSGVGGCQVAVRDGDGVLWAAGSADGGTGVLRIAVTGGNPYSVTATDKDGAPVADATVQDAGADGVLASTGARTDSQGRATVTLAPGYHRLKVARPGYVRSRRAVVCVEPCGAAPPDVATRTVPAPVTVSAARFSRSGYWRGLVRLIWKVSQSGVRLKSWRIASDDLSTRARAYRTRARGSTATQATLRLPAGRTHALRFIGVDRLQRPVQTDLGRVTVPLDDRSKSAKRRGSWRKLRSATAWMGTLVRGRPGARLRVRLAAGRPALMLAGKRRAVVRVGSKRLRVRGGRTALGAKRRKAGFVTITVVRGSIDLDGVAASP